MITTQVCFVIFQIYNPSPSESSDEDDNDIYLVQWALTIALLERDPDFSDFLFWDSSDSD